ncbi:hypothetical protein OO009_00125 [Flavobacteriaceae bacterium KMM 6897]|nr:hypothetical protein [Flavobacteriaceae bacterium KMM 6897]
MNKILFTLILFSICNKSIAQTVETKNLEGIDFYIHKEVTNANGEVEQELIELWQNYISNGNFQDVKSPYWSFKNMKVPDENLWAIDIVNLKKKEYTVQCKIIGIFEVENGYWSLISSFSHIDKSGEIHIDVISSVYATKINGQYLLISSAEYLKSVFEHHRVGNINYYVHPFHKFKLAEAEQMNEFNLEMAKEFGVEPLEFDYFVASNARDIARTWGYEYMNRMYNPSGKGGIASWRNMIIYSGNNNSYFPHELVHLYTYHVVPKDPHLWVGEGIATFYAGTSTYSFHEHMLKLKVFLAKNPEYALSDISELKKTIPNGEHKSDFRYVIGALLMKNIYGREGIKGLIESLKYGTTEADFYLLIEDKLGVTKDEFDQYIKNEMKIYSEQ